jgi:predicted HicB family RNase H-like nuclease
MRYTFMPQATESPTTIESRTSRKYVRVRVPMPKPMRARITALARAEGVSFNSYVNAILAEAFAPSATCNTR